MQNTLTPQHAACCRFPVRDLSLFLPQRFISRGRNYFTEGRVEQLVLELDPDTDTDLVPLCEGEAAAHVRGSGHSRYHTRLYWAVEDGQLLTLEGHCTCPVAYNCKHVAAVVYAVIQVLKHPPRPQSDDDWKTRLPRLSQRLKGGIPNTLDEFIAWQLIEQRERPFLRPMLTHRNRNRPERINKGQLYRGYHRKAGPTPLDAAVIQHGRPYEDEISLDLIDTALLRALVQTGRVWLSKDYPDPHAALRWNDEAFPLEFHWENDRGRWALRYRLPDGICLWQRPQSWLACDPAHRTLQTVALPLPAWQLSLLLKESWRLNSPESVEAFSRYWQLHFGHLPDLPPPVKTTFTHRTTRPVALLTLQPLAHESTHVHLILSGWRYGQRTLHPEAPDAPVEDGDTLWQRDPAAERDILATFENWLQQQGTPLQRVSAAQPARWEWAEKSTADYSMLDALDTLLREHDAYLRQQGIEIHWPDTVPRITGVNTFSATLTQDPLDDALTLNLQLELDGRKLPLAPLVAQALEPLEQVSSGRPLPDKLLLEDPEANQLLRLPTATLRPYLEALYSLQARGALSAAKPARLTPLEAAALKDAPALETDPRADDTLQRLRQLSTATAPTVPIPATFRAHLRPYQQQGVNWLQFLRAWQLGGILADDMGLGKTVQTLAHLCIEQEAGRLDRPALIVSPTSVAANWLAEAQRFTPHLRTLLLHGPQRQQHFTNLSDYDIVLTTYPLLVRDFGTLQEQTWSWLILDEAHHIKNPRAKVSQLARQLQSRHRLCLTGTPLENNLEELWSLFDFLMPGLLGPLNHFRKYWRTPIEKHAQGDLLALPQRKLAPLMLRRTKEQVARELPPKNEMTVQIALNDRQRTLYDSVRLTLEKTVREALEKKGLAKSHITVLTALLKLRQICCDPALLKELQDRKAPPSAKLDALVDMVTELVEEGRRILIFSQFAQMLSRIEVRLKQAGIPSLKLTGRTRRRQQVIDAFRQGKTSVFLISLKAGGVGINLTEADTVILYDPWWNPAAENQAIDRAYRIGQDKPVFVYRLITEGTIEEKILALQQHKLSLAEGVQQQADPDQPAFRLTEEDIRNLFAAPPELPPVSDTSGEDATAQLPG